MKKCNRLYILDDPSKNKLLKQLRDKNYQLYGYNKKFLIDAVLQDFISGVQYQPTEQQFLDLERYLKLRVGSCGPNGSKPAPSLFPNQKKLLRERRRVEEYEQYLRDNRKYREEVRALHRPLTKSRDKYEVRGKQFGLDPEEQSNREFDSLIRRNLNQASEYCSLTQHSQNGDQSELRKQRGDDEVHARVSDGQEAGRVRVARRVEKSRIREVQAPNGAR